MIADIEVNKKMSPIVTEFFLRGRKIIISLAFVSQSCFKVPKPIRLNATNYFTMKIYLAKENFIKQYRIIHLTLSVKIL